jgi:RNA polymerase sigma factor (sigma-70 family)
MPDRDTSRILDEWLVLRAQGGDDRAFTRLAERWQRRVILHAFRLTGDRQAAADIAQDTWVAVARGLRRLDDARAFRAWIFTIVRRRASDWIRTRRRDRGVVSTGTDEAPDRVDGPGDRHALRAALAQLDAGDREILVLRHLEDLSVAELARVLAVPNGTVKSRLFAARRKLRALLEGESPEGDHDGTR